MSGVCWIYIYIYIGFDRSVCVGLLAMTEKGVRANKKVPYYVQRLTYILFLDGECVRLFWLYIVLKKDRISLFLDAYVTFVSYSCFRLCI